jgi:pre-mRNA-splicing factor ATP-dependent RNA helicase DHX16
MRMVTPIQSEWLIELAPHFYKKEDIEDTVNKKMPKVLGKISQEPEKD